MRLNYPLIRLSCLVGWRLSRTAAAVFVIGQEDIRRSGATVLPDVLRLAPGVQVAQIDTNAWAITIRGFNSRYFNKVLVLIDGRSVYTPGFSGVYWDQPNIPLEDIDRIGFARKSILTLRKKPVCSSVPNCSAWPG
jgi:iron complex outermembrane receptor protein